MRSRTYAPPSATAKEGTVIESLPSLAFRIKMRDTESEVLGYLAGKMKMNHIRVLPGDRVLVEMSPDGRRGRIVRRL
jgi:translation initiation factor IF-1